MRGDLENSSCDIPVKLISNAMIRGSVRKKYTRGRERNESHVVEHVVSGAIKPCHTIRVGEHHVPYDW